MYLNIITLQILNKLKNLMNYPDNERGVEINRLIEFLTLMIDDKLGIPTNKIESTRILNRIFRVNMTELSGNPIYQQNPMIRINETFFFA